MHGGLSPELKRLDQLRQVERPIHDVEDGIIADLLWSDPDRNTNGTGPLISTCFEFNRFCVPLGWQPSDRGVGYTFGTNEVVKACEGLDIDMVVRAHQVVMLGYEFFAGERLITLFSAPNYCGEFDNVGAVMVVDAGLLCTFKVSLIASPYWIPYDQGRRVKSWITFLNITYHIRH